MTICPNDLNANAKEQKAIEWLHERIMYHQGGGRIGTTDQYEYKQWNIERIHSKAISLIVEVGQKGDEGTMAEVFARDRRHIFIGPRGGMRLVNAKNKRKARGVAVPYAQTAY